MSGGSEQRGVRDAIGQIARPVRDAFAFGAAGRRGATLGLCVAIALFYGFLLTAKVTPGAVNPLLFVVAFLRLAQATLAGLAVLLLLSRCRRRPRLLSVLLLTLASSVFVEYLGIPLPGVLALFAGVALCPLVLGTGLAAFAATRGAGGVRGRRIAAASTALIGGLGSLLALSWFFGEGYPVARSESAALLAVPLPERVAVSDPSQPGPHRVLRIAYGSGRDRWRPEFGEEPIS